MKMKEALNPYSALVEVDGRMQYANVVSCRNVMKVYASEVSRRIGRPSKGRRGIPPEAWAAILGLKPFAPVGVGKNTTFLYEDVVRAVESLGWVADDVPVVAEAPADKAQTSVQSDETDETLRLILDTELKILAALKMLIRARGNGAGEQMELFDADAGSVKEAE